MTIEERLDVLERELARAKGRCGLGPVDAQEAVGAPKKVCAGKFSLVDQNGNIRAWLAVTKGGPGLALVRPGLQHVRPLRFHRFVDEDAEAVGQAVEAVFG